MARIVITTFGSTGDLNPFISLGLALRSNGHDVLFAVEANFEQRLSSLGFPVRVLKGDHAEALGPYSHQIFNSDQQLTSLKLLVDRYILPTLTAKLAELREICQEADLLISVASQFAASIVAEMLQIPWIAVILKPATLPSASIAAQPMPVQLPAHLQRLSNRLSWFLGGIFLLRIADKPVNQLRRTFHVPPLACHRSIETLQSPVRLEWVAYPSHRERTSPSLQTAGSAILVRSVLKEYQGIQRKKYRILPRPA